MTGPTAAIVIENVAQTRHLETALDDRPTNTGSGSNEDDHEDRYNFFTVHLAYRLIAEKPNGCVFNSLSRYLFNSRKAMSRKLGGKCRHNRFPLFTLLFARKKTLYT